MPYPHFHTARIADPSRFSDFRTTKNAFGTGVDAVYGIRSGSKRGPRGGRTVLQSVRFDKDKFTAAQAKRWLDDHDFEYQKFEPASGRVSASRNLGHRHLMKGGHYRMDAAFLEGLADAVEASPSRAFQMGDRTLQQVTSNQLRAMASRCGCNHHGRYGEHQGPAASKSTMKGGDYQIADVTMMWKLMISSVYANADSLVVGVREALQNSRDAGCTVFEVNIAAQPDRYITHNKRQVQACTVTITDNGKGMSPEIVEGKFLSLAGTTKIQSAINEGNVEEALGGFGVAKAAILGMSTTLKWEIHTGDYYWTSVDPPEGYAFGSDRSNEYVKGVRIVLYDVPYVDGQLPGFSNYLTPEERIRELFQMCHLPKVELRTIVYTQGIGTMKTVPQIGAKGGVRMKDWEEGWGSDITAKVRRFPSLFKHGWKGVFVRLKGIFHFGARYYGGDPSQCVFVDISSIKTSPQSGDYPLVIDRSQFRSGTDAYYQLNRLADRIATEKEDIPEFDIFDINTGNNADKAESIAKSVRESLDNVEVQERFQVSLKSAKQADKSISDVLEKLAKLSQEGRAKFQEGDKNAWTSPLIESLVNVDAITEPPMFEQDRKGGKSETEVLGGMLSQWTGYFDAMSDQGPQKYIKDADDALVEVARRLQDTPPDEESQRTQLRRAHEAIIEDGPRYVKGLLQLAMAGQLKVTISEWLFTVIDFIDFLSDQIEKSGEGSGIGETALHTLKNYLRPRAVALRAESYPLVVSRNYNNRKAGQFRRHGFKKHFGLLMTWEYVVSQMVLEVKSIYGINKSVQVGFVLDDEGIRGLMQPSGNMIMVMINPEWFHDEVLRIYGSRIDLMAVMLHSLAAHETAHVAVGSHNEDFSRLREHLGKTTVYMLPAIEAYLKHALELSAPLRLSGDALKSTVESLDRDAYEQRLKEATEEAKRYQELSDNATREAAVAYAAVNTYGRKLDDLIEGLEALSLGIIYRDWLGFSNEGRDLLKASLLPGQTTESVLREMFTNESTVAEVVDYILTKGIQQLPGVSIGNLARSVEQARSQRPLTASADRSGVFLETPALGHRETSTSRHPIGEGKSRRGRILN